MHVGFVITEVECGVFVGTAMGLAFFSALDAAGQYQAPVNTEAVALQIIERLVGEAMPRQNLTTVRVETAHPDYATPSELAAAGVRHDWLTALYENERMAQRVGVDPAPPAAQPIERVTPVPTHAAPRRVQ